MNNVDIVCDFKNQGSSITILYIFSNDLIEVRKALRHKRKQARAFFEACPIVVSFSKIDCDNIDLIDNVFKILKEENFLPVGVSDIKAKLRDDLLLRKIPVYAINDEPQKEKIKSETLTVTEKEKTKSELDIIFNLEKEKEKEKIKIETEPVFIFEKEENFNSNIEKKLTKTQFDSVRGGQKVMARGQNLNIFGTVNSSAEIAASGSILVTGGLNGSAAAGIDGDSSATITAFKFDAFIVSINGIYKVFEDGVPEEYKNHPVIIYIEDGHIQIKKI